MQSAQWIAELSHVMANGWRRLRDMVVGTTALSSDPVWLLGRLYAGADDVQGDTPAASLPPQVQEALLADLAARLWFTYRRDFAPLGAAALTSDVGWGCTLRSGQMLLAEALLRLHAGRQTSRPAGDAAASPAAEVVRLFLDSPDLDGHPLGLHALCHAGAELGVVPGRWLGPWVLCHAIEAAARRAPHIGLKVHVVNDPGGGAPTLLVHRVRPLLQHAQAAPAPGPSARGDEGADSAAGTSSPAAQQQAAAGAPADAPTPAALAAADTGGGAGGRHGLLLLVPLTLGVGQVDPRYLLQLTQLLQAPQSVGIVGGRPGASLYFLGFQAQSVLYLDPHEAQQAAHLPEGLPSFFCNAVRLMPLTAIDPSLAIGFYCGSEAEFDDLAARLASVAAAAGTTALLSVAAADSPSWEYEGGQQRRRQQQQQQHQAAEVPGGAAAGEERDDWELV